MSRAGLGGNDRNVVHALGLEAADCGQASHECEIRGGLVVIPALAFERKQVIAKISAEYSSERSPVLRLYDARRKGGQSSAHALLDDGRICMSNNATEREILNNWTFAGSDAGGRRAAMIYTLIQTARLNDDDPQASLADALARLGSSGQAHQ